jgi:hypothetical protein
VPTVGRFAARGVRADGHPVPKAFFDAGVSSSSSSDYPVRDFFPQTRIGSGVLNGVPPETMIASHTVACTPPYAPCPGCPLSDPKRLPDAQLRQLAPAADRPLERALRRARLR